jgi:sensor histidine kinase YesM
MNGIDSQSDTVNPWNGPLYWRCQIAGWSAFAIFEFGSIVALWGKQTSVPILAVYTCLVGLEGLLGTHLLHLSLQKRQWLHSPGNRLVPRLVIAVFSLAALLATAGLLTRGLLSNLPLRQVLNTRDLLVMWIIRIVALVIWITLYVALHELQLRRAAEKRALRLEVVAQEAQLRGLRAQLNPHFFFNCLNNLRELISENPKRAQLMVTQLGELLRYSLRTHQSELVSLSDEIRAVEDYLALEASRFEERLHVRWDIAREARAARIPPMLLQTLVENALKHGIARRPEGGEVVITARAADHQIELEVLNSGELREPPSSAPGIGLRNARERLSLLYGDRAKLLVEDSNDGSVRARVTLPLTPVEVAP